MTGTITNATLIIIFTLLGIFLKSRLPVRLQFFSRNLLAGFTFFIGIKLLIKSFDPGFFIGAKLIILALISIVLGNLVGKLLKLQTFSNRLGNYSNEKLGIASKKSTLNADKESVSCSQDVIERSNGIQGKSSNEKLLYSDSESHKQSNQNKISPLNTIAGIAILFCLNPVGIIGAIYEGLRFAPYIIIIKAVMDCFLSYSIAHNFKLKIIAAIFPMVIWQGFITIAFNNLAKSTLFSNELILFSYDTLIGLFCFLFILPILEIRKVEFANYLPSILIIPFLVKFFL